MKKRCDWAGTDPDYIRYHDTEWGVPVHDDKKLFELLVLEGAQAGLNWLTILRKRPAYRAAFDGFDPERVARYDSRKIERLMADPGIVRNRLKITAAVTNAKAFLKVRETFGSFDAYIWSFVNGRPVVNAWKTTKQLPARTAVSEAMSRDLKKRGFAFIGPVICYAFMQSAGLVNDHLVDCFRYHEVQKKRGRRQQV
ncbi:MAG: DNA-3-methyladenine glycosylase I [Thermodesulfobacteriota bacterium]